jgi:hypothetical protein
MKIIFANINIKSLYPIWLQVGPELLAELLHLFLLIPVVLHLTIDLSINIGKWEHVIQYFVKVTMLLDQVLPT